MEKQGIIQKVNGPSEWVNSLVTIVKPNKVRLCIDPKDLNKAIKREHYPMRTIEEVVSRMPNAKIFSALDCSNGFYQIKLDEESAKLCTFNTPFGRYRFHRLPFGICSAPEIYQKVMNQIFDDIEGVEVIVDDLLIWGENEEQHDARLRKVLQRAKERNLTLNRSKCKIKQKEISYIGHILTSEGLKPDPKKVEAVSNMPKPTDKESLRRFLGMITYLSKFIPKLSQLGAPLRSLIEKESPWI